MWPYASDLPGDEVSLPTLCARLNEVNDELVARLGSDGKLRVTHPANEAIVVATLDLTSPWPLGPAIEQLARFPGLLKSDLTSTWPEFEDYIDPETPFVIKGPALLLEIGAAVDFYGDRPPWEEGAQPTRRLTAEDVRGGWYVDFHDAVFSSRRTYVRYRQRPIPMNGDRRS